MIARADGTPINATTIQLVIDGIAYRGLISAMKEGAR